MLAVMGQRSSKRLWLAGAPAAAFEQAGDDYAGYRSAILSADVTHFVTRR